MVAVNRRVAGSNPWWGATIYIRSDDGQSKTIIRGDDLPNHFGIDQSELFPGVMNWIQIETTATCGRTGYSNAASYSYYPNNPAPSCITAMAGGRSGLPTQTMATLSGNQVCPPGTTYNIYFQRAGTTNIVRVSPFQPLGTPSIVLSNLPCGSGEGDYWIVPMDPNTHTAGVASPRITMDSSSCGGGPHIDSSAPPEQPGVPSMNMQFISWDHLGSTRLVTDENGVAISVFKYYPFGHEAESSGDPVRQKFTGHERDDLVGLDYMMARSSRTALARFLEPDSEISSAHPISPQSWNLYVYALNSPMNLTDPDGKFAIFFLGTSETRDQSPPPALATVAESLETKSTVIEGPKWYSWGSTGRRASAGATAAMANPDATLELVGFSRGAQAANLAAGWSCGNMGPVDLLVTVDPELNKAFTIPSNVRFAVNITDGIYFHGNIDRGQTGPSVEDRSRTTFVNLRLTGPNIGNPLNTSSHGATVKATAAFVRSIVRLAEIGMLNKTTLKQAVDQFNEENAKKGLKLTEEEVKKNQGSE